MVVHQLRWMGFRRNLINETLNHFVLDGNVDYATITRYEYCKEKLVVLRIDRQEAQNLADTLNEWIRVCKKIEEIK